MAEPLSDQDSRDGFHGRLWRGERMCLVGMDIDQPEDDLVGFAIEVQRPGATEFTPLRNRLAFGYGAGDSVTGARQFDSTEAPFQKFRWVHFPYEPETGGAYGYRVTKMHMPQDGRLVKGTALDLAVSLDSITCPGFLDVGFTRNFASSQAYNEKFGARTDILPADADAGFDFAPPANSDEVYRWLGFESVEIVETLLDEVVRDKTLTLDFFAYDLNLRPQVIDKLAALGPRLRAVIDDSGTHEPTPSSESRAAALLMQSAGAANVKRTHFRGLQHNKVLIVKRNGTAERVVLGSTNFSYRGFFIQANNILLFSDADVAGLFAKSFEQAFTDPDNYSKSDLANKWHVFQPAGHGAVHVCLSPHDDTDLSLNPVGAAIDQAASSVLYAVAFLGQTKKGPVHDSLQRLTGRPLFSYGIADKRGNLAVNKPDGSVGLVDFAYLSKTAPEPFKTEWNGSKGINIHHKFVVTDFNLPTAKVFTGSSNLSPSGEQGNGDHLLMIEDQAVAHAYAIEALRMFDHLHFRSAMKQHADKGAAAAAAAPKPKAMTLAKPKAISGEDPWFSRFYIEGSQNQGDRKLFGR
jgi:PLD-like domain